MMSLEEFNTGFNYLIGHFPNTKNLKAVSYAYFEDLKDTLTGNEFIFAIKKIVRNKKRDFIPGVGEIIETAKGTGNINNLIISAKRMLKAGIIKYGRTGMINFQDRGVHAVIDYVGWLRLLNMNETEFEKFLDFQFDGVYKEFMKNPYNTSEYYTGTSQLFGQENPIMITYESIGLNPMGLDFIALNYKSSPKVGVLKSNVENLKKKMLLGG